MAIIYGGLNDKGQAFAWLDKVFMHVPEILPSLRVDVVIDNLRDVAIVYGALGEKDKAFMWLEKEIVARASRPPLFSVNPVFDDLRDDPRFQELVRRVNAAKLD